MSDIGPRVQALRTSLHLSRAAVAQRAGLSASTVKNVERGKCLTVLTVQRVAAALQVPLERLLGAPEPSSLPALYLEMAETLDGAAQRLRGALAAADELDAAAQRLRALAGMAS